MSGVQRYTCEISLQILRLASTARPLFVVTDPDGKETVGPAFWAGGSFWGVRYSSSTIGQARRIGVS